MVGTGSIAEPYDEIKIGEGTGDYLAISYRRTLSTFQPNNVFPWSHNITDIPLVDMVRKLRSDYRYPENWVNQGQYVGGTTWASTLMDIQTAGVSRDIITKLFFTSCSYVSPTSLVHDHIYAILQSDIDLYNGVHISTLVTGFNNRGFIINNLYVPQQYSTIQSALSAANSGQTIVIGSGTFNENLTVGNKNNITIRGQGTASTIINGSLSAYFCNNLKIKSLRLNSLSATYCNLGDFHNNINSGGMALYSCTGFDQFGYISNCSTGLFTSSSSGHIYPTSNFSSNGTSIHSGPGNILVDCSRLCTSTNYDFAASGGSYITSYLSYFRNGQPRINYLGGTVSVNYPMSCGMAKESNTEEIQDDFLLTPIETEDPVETEFSKINVSYFNLLKEIKEAKEKGKPDNGELKNQLLNNSNEFKNFIKKNPESSLSRVAFTTAANSYPLYEDNAGMKNFLNEIINDKELVFLKGAAENLMIDYHININDFDRAVSMADAFINNYKSNDELLCEGLLKNGLILAHKLNQPEKAIECYSAIVNNYPDNPLAEFAKNEFNPDLSLGKNF